MKPIKNYNIAIKEWPNEISLTDSIIIEKSNGFLSPQLNYYRDKIESECNDDELDLVHWAVFQEFHRVAKIDFSQGKPVTLKSSLSKEQILSNLVMYP